MFHRSIYRSLSGTQNASFTDLSGKAHLWLETSRAACCAKSLQNSLLTMKQQEKGIWLGWVVNVYRSFVITGKYPIRYFTREAMMSWPEAQLVSIFRLVSIWCTSTSSYPCPYWIFLEGFQLASKLFARAHMCSLPAPLPAPTHEVGHVSVPAPRPVTTVCLSDSQCGVLPHALP